MFQEDFKQFLKDFGEPVSFVLPNETVIDKNSQNKDILGIYDETYADSALGYLPTRNDKPRLTCIQSEVASVIKGSSVSVRNKTFKVLTIDGDGTGFAIIELSKQ